MTNPWHDIEPGQPEKFNVLIELGGGSKNKYEIDKKTGLLTLDRVSHTTQDFPFDYGFIPQTLWDDGDPIDVILLTTYPLQPGVLVRARPVALLQMIDTDQADDKLIAVPVDDPRWQTIKDLADINPHTLKELTHFYSTYKQLQNKPVRVSGFSGRTEAEKAFQRGVKLYKEKLIDKKIIQN